MRPLLRFIPALFLVALPGCQNVREIAPRNAGRLTKTEMLQAHFQDVYEAVESLRSTWLNVHGPDSFRRPSQVLVYYDEVRLGGVSTLRTVMVDAIAWIRFYNGVEATMRFGVGHSAGVIYISSFR